jgi:superfamily II DNA or RNA helicase
VDFRVNGLGTCKHIEAVWLHLERRARGAFRNAQRQGADRIEIVPDREQGTLRVLLPARTSLPASLRRWFTSAGVLQPDADPGKAVERLRDLGRGGLPALRVSQEADAWLELRRRSLERHALRREYELKVQSGEWPPHETRVPLFPYQREGMLHLAFTERALLADEMGLGKTIQAVAACALLHRLGRVRRVLVVTPASLKAEWEEQIRRFTTLPCHLVFGGRHRRLAYLRSVRDGTASASSGPDGADPFFVVMNYEQVVPDLAEVNDWLRPEAVILDEAQRIKNWNTKTALTIKRVRSRYAFVLTGTPIENRIDELRSLVDFLDPSLLGPLFRFNRDFYEFDDRGRPVGYRNLALLHERVRPVLLRRRKADVETELPPRTERNLFVPMTDAQRKAYGGYEQEVMRLVMIAQRRPLTEREQERMQIQLGMMRMTCDTPFILDRHDRTCPKLEELGRIIEDCRDNDTQAIVFSEWERMLVLVRDWCDEHDIRYAWHTGSVPQQQRRAGIQEFKSDPECRVFLSTDAGATGLNLQNASVVVNCDLPWNPARLEQRIARAWRKHQTRSVTVIHLIAENTLEHRMLGTLATKRSIAESVLDRPGSVDRIPLRSGRQAMVERIRGLVESVPATPESPTIRRPAGSDQGQSQRERLAAEFGRDPAGAFARFAATRLGPSLVAGEERRAPAGKTSVVCLIVDTDANARRDQLDQIRTEFFGAVGEDASVEKPGGSPFELEVIDRATRDTIERLIAAGLLAPTAAFTRSLSLEPEPAEPPPLSAEEAARLREAAGRGRHALRRARVLGEAGFGEECRASLLEAAFQGAVAQAIRRRLPEPTSLEASLEPPYATVWGEGAVALGAVVADPAAAWSPAADAVEAACAAVMGG